MNTLAGNLDNYGYASYEQRTTELMCHEMHTLAAQPWNIHCLSINPFVTSGAYMSSHLQRVFSSPLG
jgi:hypothetical protein